MGPLVSLLARLALSYGAKTLAKKFIKSETKPLRKTVHPSIHPWMNIAMSELGQHEIEGAKHNERILRYHLFTSLKATTDEVPWCSAFACYCMENAGLLSPRSALAKSWVDWGITIKKPEVGCVVVMNRGSNPALGHVGFYMGPAGKNYIKVLGGNQGDMVCVKRYKVDRVACYKLPF